MAQTTLTPAQRGDLRTVRNLTLEVESMADRMAYHINEWRGLGSQVGDTRVANFNRDAEALAAAYTRASETVATLPGDHEEVADLVDRLNAGAAAYQEHIASAQALIAGAGAALEEVGGHEAIAADIERLDAITHEYAGFEAMMTSEPGRALELIRQFTPAVEELQGFEQKYAEFLEQDNADTGAIRRQLDEARSRLVAAQRAGQARVADVRDFAGRTLDELERMVQTAVDERRPAYFGEHGGVPPTLEQAKQFVLLARAIHAADAQPLVDRWEAANQRVAEAKEALVAEVMAANRPPADAYAGADHDALVEGARAAWLAEHPDDEILRITIPTAQWRREAKWEWWLDAWYFTDVSRLQAAVLIAATGPDGEPEAHHYPVNIMKDHEADDAISYSPWVKEEDGRVDVTRRILLENL